MTKHQLKQARRDRQEKQYALYGYCLNPTPVKEGKTIRWGAVFMAVCLAGLLWLYSLIFL